MRAKGRARWIAGVLATLCFTAGARADLVALKTGDGSYLSAEDGIALLPDRSARCVRAAHTLYGRILDRIELADYDVFAERASVPTREKALLAARLLTPSRRRRFGSAGA